LTVTATPGRQFLYPQHLPALQTHCSTLGNAFGTVQGHDLGHLCLLTGRTRGSKRSRDLGHTQFENPGGSIDSRSGFGIISGSRDPRIGQVALTLSF
jgi:hypothetical protein